MTTTKESEMNNRGRPDSLFDGHLERLSQLRDGLDTGAAMADELRDVIDVLLAIVEDVARMDLNARAAQHLGSWSNPTG